MTNSPRPMLACNEIVEDLDSISYPVIASPKLDGIRSFNVNGLPRTRSGLTIPNKHTQAILSRPELEGLDGELICGSPTDPNSMQKAQSAFSTIRGEPDFTWYIFDDWKRAKRGYWSSWYEMFNPVRLSKLPSFIKLLAQIEVSSARELEAFATDMLALGYEGVITRQPDSPYKGYDGRANRSTRKQEWMLKVKPWLYEEAIVVGFTEKKHNFNEATISELGFTKRSTSQDGKEGAGTLGSFILQSPKYNETFKVGCGKMDDATKQLLWDTRNEKRGRICTFRHLSKTGFVNKPRNGQFVAFRALEDM